MQEQFRFYYDESEHSRKINSTTLMSDNYFDSFITAIVGWRNDTEECLNQEYLEFEKKYSKRKSDGELKSTTIKNKQLKYGFSSLSKDNVEFLNDFFDLFDETIYIYFAVISKTEYVIHQLFKDYRNNLFTDIDSMKYSIIKSIVRYRPKELIEGIYSSSDEFIRLLRKFLNERIELNKSNQELKAKETEAYMQMLVILEDINEDFNIDWEYRIAFEGFKKYLKEKKIHEYTLTLDEEGSKGNTRLAAISVGLENVVEIDSKNSIGVRWADMLAGIIAKLMKLLRTELIYKSMEDGTNKKLLNENWFKVNDSQFSLYKKFCHIIARLNNAWYKAYAGLYSDDLIVFIGYLNYMNHFESVEEIDATEYKLHAEYFNASVCEELNKYFTRVHSKLPIEPVVMESEEYFVGQRGQKIYVDESKQPLLQFEEAQRTYNVLSVGFSKNNVPNVTVSEGEKSICYSIPQELFDWVMTCVGFANMGQNLFPSKVVFSKCDGKMYADIL